MSTQQAIPSGGSQVVIPSHVLPWLRAAADYELELACDTGGEWNDEIRERVLHAVHTIQALDIGLITAYTIELVTGRAISGQHGPFPLDDLPEADAVRAQDEAVRELISCRYEARRRVCER